jgi:membrane-bound metal-dependent hydrolase YbcI (DUF457 family)
LAEASSLVSLDLRKSNFYLVKSYLWISRLVILVLLVLWYLWYFWYWFSGTFGTFVKLGFHFLGDPATEKVRSKCQIDPGGRTQLSRCLGS